MHRSAVFIDGAYLVQVLKKHGEPAVQAAKDAGVLTQLHYSSNAVHDELLDTCDDCFEITTDLIDEVMIRK